MYRQQEQQQQQTLLSKGCAVPTNTIANKFIIEQKKVTLYLYIYVYVYAYVVPLPFSHNLQPSAYPFLLSS